MIPDSRSCKKERDLVSRLILLFVIGLMFLFGLFGVYHLLYFTTENSSLLPYVRFMLGLGLVTAVLSGVAIIRKKWHIENAVAVTVFLLGLLYLFAMTPLSVPDEGTHYQSSYELSNVLCFQWNERGQGRASDFDYSGLVIQRNVSSAYSRIEGGITTEDEDSSLVPIPYYALAYPLEYAPQAVGITLGRLFHANFIVTFSLGRLFNLLFYVLCVFLAVRRVPRFKLLFGLIGMLPMALHQAASYSYDGFINGMSLLLIALILHSIGEESSFSRKEAFQICAVSMLLAPAKMIYWVITLLVLLIPGTRFKSIRQRALFIGIVLVVPLVFAGLLQLSTLSSIAARPEGRLNWEGGTNYTVDFILHHPVQTVRLFLRSFVYYAAEWFECGLGSHLSGLSLKISLRTIYAFVFLLLVASQYTGVPAGQIRSGERASFLAASFAVVLLAMLSMFLAWTSDTRDMVEGVQGRYFIPILPLLFLSCNNGWFKVMKPVERPVLLASVFLNLHVIVQVLAYTVVH